MTRKSKARFNLNRTYKVSQTVKALRRALALGLATAVVAPAAQAGTCISVINDVFCFGDFGDDTLDSWNELSVDDTFDPATVEMDGSIYTDNTAGMVVWNDADLAFVNDGFVIVNDNVYQTNSYNRVGVYAESFQGDVTFDNTGVIAAVENSGNNFSSFTVGARVEAAQDITITNSGFIASENDGGFSAGLQALSYNDGVVSITNTLTGDFGAEANFNGTAVALGVYGAGTVNITNNGDIAAASDDYSAFGIRVFGGDTTITTGSTSEINVQADDQAYGMDVQAYNNQTVDITNGGLIETDAGGDAYGIRVEQSGYGDVTVSNSGTIDSYAVNGFASGIAVYANAGDVSVTNSQYGTLLSDGNDDSFGIAVRAEMGDITVSNAGDIYSTSENAAGIGTFSKYLNTVDITNSGTIGVIAENPIFGSSAAGVYAIGFSNDTTVTNSGEIYAVNGSGTNAGVLIIGAGKYSEGGTATVTNTGVISAGRYSEVGSNSLGDAFGVGVLVNGDITVTNTGTEDQFAGILAYNEDGGQVVGVQASSNYGNVSVTNSNKYSVITAVSADNSGYGTSFSTTIGIYAEAFDGSVNVNNGGIVFSINDNYGDAIGIRAEANENDMMGPLAAYAADGDITVTNTGFIAAVSKYDNAAGVQAFSNYGDITISNTGGTAALKYALEGVIYAIAEDGDAVGIQAQTGADGTITVSNTGAYVIAEGYYGATGISADTYSGDISVTNASSADGYGGVVAASAYNGDATGIDAFSDYGNISVTNSGYVVAESAYDSAFGINAETGNYSDGTITVTNTGSVIAEGYYSSIGINANSDTGAITISNNTDANGNGGVINASASDYGYAYGINAEINDSMSTANITITNGYGALITATANYTGEEADSYGIKAENNGDGDILITNAGTVRAESYDDAQAIYAIAEGDGDISITNTATGKLYAESSDDEAYGIFAYAEGSGNITVTNAGVINAQTNGNSGDVHGIYAYADGSGNVTVTNSGSITATATGDYGDAYGIYAGTENQGDITVTNTASIIASTSGYSADAQGIFAYSDDGSAITVTNGQYGSITVNASGNQSFAVGIEVENDDSDNYGSITAITNNGTVTVGTTGYSSNANGIWTHGGGLHDADVTITNNGSFTVTATGVDSDAWGVEVDDIRGDTLVSVTNNGEITVAASYGSAYGIQTETYGFETNTNITNNGDLTVTTGGSSSAIGIGAYAENAGYGDITVTNTANGTIEVSSAYGSAAGVGVYAEMSGNLNDGGSVEVINAGLMLVTSYGTAAGIFVGVDAGNTIVGAQLDYCPAATPCNDVYGNYIYDAYYGQNFVSVASYTIPGQGSMPVTVNNSGSIAVYSYAESAVGIGVDMGDGNYGELASVTNSGNIEVQTQYGLYASGVTVYNEHGDISISNTATGNIEVVIADEYQGSAAGILARSKYGDITISNAGDILVGNAPFRSTGIAAYNKYGDVTVSNLAGGLISVNNTGGYDAYGIEVDNKYGDVTVGNAGAITVRGGSWNNTGIDVDNMYGDTVITTAAGSSINVIGGGDYGTIGINAISYSGNISVTNAGSLTVTAVNDAEGIHLYSDYGNVSVSNSGAVTVSSSSGNASGIYAETGDGTSSVTNSAAITVTAAEYAVGIYAYANGGNASVTNSAAGHVRATGDSATGISVQSNSYGYDVTLNNAGKITVVGNDGDAYGAYVETDGDGTLSITSSGDITVSASGIGNYAVGLYAQHEGYGDITIASSSTITVNSTGSGGDAVGIRAYSYYGSDMSVSNSGTILANATNGGLSVGIYTQNDYGTETTITNSGSVKATSNAIGDAHAIYHVGTDVDIINTTTGKIFGVVYTDFGNDTFTNNGKWYATQGTNYYSGFFSGNDDIVNSSTGKIYMEDSFIDLGSATTVNSFLNNGKIYVNGDENYIDMGNATSVFTNNGASLHFEDGAANDVLTIFGDFAGTGHIVVDANGTSMLADRLYIEGDVVSSTANVIDVYLNQNPSLQDMVDGELIDIVYVSGTSAAANFNLGIVDVEDDSLYTVDYELVKQINYSGTNDLFSLGFEISGLTPTGVAMSSIAPTVQNLWHLGVGTVFQREGTVRDLKSGGSSNSLMNAGFKNATGGNAQVADYQGAAGLWLRAFTEDGGLNPDGGRDNFGLGGAQSFDMKNSGIEFGAGYAFNSQWTAGLLGGVSDGSLKPTIGGRTSIDAKTIGGYLTYTPGNGFYADLSYRSMDFDGNGNGGGDDFSFDGKADGYSLEMGYGFKTSSGLVVEPQFQYSSMDVDLDSVDYNQGGFALDDGKSSQTRLGVSLRKTMDSGNGNSWTPYASLSYLNESNASNDYTIGGVLTGNVDTSGNSTLFEGGATVKYGNMLFSGGLNWKDGGAYESVFGGQVSVRFSW
ncbi:hypothetical protein [Arenimonas sp.]|jgi:hypothetical protein|uniref:hypothetical protein n=1 Tax=Arenimonas sp. TaxID=1872635 RepID=UPI0037C13D86